MNDFFTEFRNDHRQIRDLILNKSNEQIKKLVIKILLF